MKHWWKANEVVFLREHFASNGPDWCASHFGVTPDAINGVAKRNKIRGPYSLKSRHRWTGEDKALLRRYYAKHGPRGCAFMIGTTVRSARKYANKLGLKHKHGGRRPKVVTALAWKVIA